VLRVLLALLAGICLLTTGFAFAEDDPLVLYRSWRQCGYPDWSPDGRFIVFTAVPEGTDEGNLWLVPATGGEPVQLTEAEGHHGNFSPDGKLIALDSARGSIVQVVPASGGAAVRVVPAGVDVENSGNPCWSPDGRLLAFRANEELCTVELATGEIATVFHRDGFKPLPIHWLASENCVIASLINVEEHTANLHRIDLDSGEATQLTDELRVTQGTVSPDETMLVYSAFSDPEAQDYDLWAIPLAGGERIRLTGEPLLELEPCWSPDGTQLVYVAFFEGEFRIQVMDVSADEINAGWSVPGEKQ
jgi:Tol biopolymer transport system component